MRRSHVVGFASWVVFFVACYDARLGSGPSDSGVESGPGMSDSAGGADSGTSLMSNDAEGNDSGRSAPSCQSDSDCVAGQRCGFTLAMGCAGKGICLDAQDSSTGLGCIDPGGRCGCDGQYVDIFCGGAGGTTEFTSRPANRVGPCPGPVEGGTNDGGTNDGGTNDGGTPAPDAGSCSTISFRADLLAPPAPAVGFESSCGLSTSCHHDAVIDPKTDRVFLGCDPMNPSCTAMGDIGEQVYMGIVNKPTQEDPMLNYVTPNDPDHSYLLLKIENNLSGLTCTPVNMDPIVANAPGLPGPPVPCGYSMPLMADLLPDFANKVRCWITQGAPDN